MVFRLPAFAGMANKNCSQVILNNPDPRIRGDDRNKMAEKWAKSTGSPHPRGWKALLANLGC